MRIKFPYNEPPDKDAYNRAHDEAMARDWARMPDSVFEHLMRNIAAGGIDPRRPNRPAEEEAA